MLIYYVYYSAESFVLYRQKIALDEFLASKDAPLRPGVEE